MRASEVMIRVRQVALAVCMAAAVPVLATEHVTLANGYSIDCHHHAAEGGRVRLFIDRSEDSYIEVAEAAIVSYERLTSPAAEAEVEETKKTAVKTEAQLSEADLHLMMAEAGQEHHLDVDLLASVVAAESGGRQRAVSRAGARGLMQLMPATAKDLGVEHVEEPRENLRGGSRYLDWLLTRYHENLALALAAYNAGPVAVDKYGGIPPYAETRAYVARVIHEFNRRVAARKPTAKKTDKGTGDTVQTVTSPLPDSR